jgi:hypothetical protein
VSSLTVELIEAWKTVFEIGAGRGYHIDYALIRKVAEIQSNPTKLAIFNHSQPVGTIRTFNEFLEKYNFLD